MAPVEAWGGHVGLFDTLQLVWPLTPGGWQGCSGAGGGVHLLWFKTEEERQTERPRVKRTHNLTEFTFTNTAVFYCLHCLNVKFALSHFLTVCVTVFARRTVAWWSDLINPVAWSPFPSWNRLSLALPEMNPVSWTRWSSCDTVHCITRFPLVTVDLQPCRIYKSNVNKTGGSECFPSEMILLDFPSLWNDVWFWPWEVLAMFPDWTYSMDRIHRFNQCLI